jgi:hypothetical protein
MEQNKRKFVKRKKKLDSLELLKVALYNCRVARLEKEAILREIEEPKIKATSSSGFTFYYSVKNSNTSDADDEGSDSDSDSDDEVQDYISKYDEIDDESSGNADIVVQQHGYDVLTSFDEFVSNFKAVAISEFNFELDQKVTQNDPNSDDDDENSQKLSENAKNDAAAEEITNNHRNQEQSSQKLLLTEENAAKSDDEKSSQKLSENAKSDDDNDDTEGEGDSVINQLFRIVHLQPDDLVLPNPLSYLLESFSFS